MKQPQNIIYGLVDPRNGQIRYIGKSTVGIKRARAHQRTSLIEKTHKASWVKQLLKLGLVYGIVVLEVVPEPKNLESAERKWIAKFRSSGSKLTNMTDGGDGTLGRKYITSEETKRKLRKINLGKTVSPETRKKISIAGRGRPRSIAASKKCSESMRGNTNCVGRVFSLETRIKLSESAKKRWQRERESKQSSGVSSV